MYIIKHTFFCSGLNKVYVSNYSPFSIIRTHTPHPQYTRRYIAYRTSFCFKVRRWPTVTATDDLSLKLTVLRHTVRVRVFVHAHNLVIQHDGTPSHTVWENKEKATKCTHNETFLACSQTLL
jgi:hypothetical protein